MRLSVLRFVQDVGAVEAAELSLEVPLAVDPLAHHDLRLAAGEPAEVVGPPERPVETRRRDLQRVRRGHDVLDVEDRAELAADVRAIVHADAVCRRGRRPRAIDLHAQHHAGRFTAELHVEDLEAAVGGHATGDVPHLLDDRFRGHKLKKWAHAHFGPTPRLRIEKYSMPKAGLKACAYERRARSAALQGCPSGRATRS